jgi:hypothetical protein
MGTHSTSITEHALAREQGLPPGGAQDIRRRLLAALPVTERRTLDQPEIFVAALRGVLDRGGVTR